MKLFDIDPETRQVALNKPWIMLIPEFAELLKRDKGSKGDYRGDKKLKATQELTYVYFYCDFTSPIRDFQDDERKKEALYYASLEEKDLDGAVDKAIERYMDMQIKAARPFRTLRSLYRGLDAMDSYFENIDFDKKDKMGKLLNDPDSFINNAGKLNKMYANIKDFENMVEQEMKLSTGIRGPNSELSDLEIGAGKRQEFSELDVAHGSEKAGGPRTTGNFQDILREIRKQAQIQKAKDVVEEEQ